jgi:hypothetical protein
MVRECDCHHLLAQPVSLVNVFFNDESRFGRGDEYQGAATAFGRVFASPDFIGNLSTRNGDYRWKCGAV